MLTKRDSEPAISFPTQNEFDSLLKSILSQIKEQKALIDQLSSLQVNIDSMTTSQLMQVYNKICSAMYTLSSKLPKRENIKKMLIESMSNSVARLTTAIDSDKKIYESLLSFRPVIPLCEKIFSSNYSVSESQETLLSFMQENNVSASSLMSKLVKIQSIEELTQSEQESCCRNIENQKINFHIQKMMLNQIHCSGAPQEIVAKEGVRSSLYCALEVKHKINVFIYNIVLRYILPHPEHCKGWSSQKMFYEPIKQILGIITYVPVELISISPFLDRLQNQFNTFKNTHVHVEEIIKKQLPELSLEDQKSLMAEIEETRSFIIQFSEKAFDHETEMAAFSSVETRNTWQKELVLELMARVEQYSKSYNNMFLTSSINIEHGLIRKALADPQFYIKHELESWLRANYEFVSMHDMALLMKEIIKPKENTKAPSSLQVTNAPTEAEKKIVKQNTKNRAHEKSVLKAASISISQCVSVLDDNSDSTQPQAIEPNSEEAARPSFSRSAGINFNFFKCALDAAQEEYQQSRSLTKKVLDEHCLFRADSLFAKNVQINAILFQIGTFMEKRKIMLRLQGKGHLPDGLQAQYTRNAIFHCNGLIHDIDLKNDETYQSILDFAKDVSRCIEQGHFSMTSSFYQEVFNHGKYLQQFTEQISQNDRIFYTKDLSNQLIKTFQEFDIPQRMLEDFFKMTASKMQIYGLYQFPKRIINLICAARHGHDIKNAELSNLVMFVQARKN